MCCMCMWRVLVRQRLASKRWDELAQNDLTSTVLIRLQDGGVLQYIRTLSSQADQRVQYIDSHNHPTKPKTRRWSGHEEGSTERMGKQDLPETHDDTYKDAFGHYTRTRRSVRVSRKQTRTLRRACIYACVGVYTRSTPQHAKKPINMIGSLNDTIL